MLNLYSTKQQKERVDNSLSLFLEANGWSQSFKLEFIRIGLGYLAVAVAVCVYYLEIRSGKSFSEVRFISGVLCGVYFIIQGFIWYRQKYIEKNAMFIGSKDNRMVYITSITTSNPAEYKLEASSGPPPNGDHKKEYSFLYNELVDEQGIVHTDKFSLIVDDLNKKLQ